ncbi:MAG: NAD(P)-dependent alcohol dehydrogenase [Chloroflexota bacterium]
MNAFTYERYGSPEELNLSAVEKPTPAAEEVLVKIEVISLNPADWRLLRADPAFMRLERGLFQPKMPVIGGEIAGRIEAVGPSVTRFKPGDLVFGEIGTGGFAEFACAAEEKFELVPSSVSLEAAATVSLAGGAALKALTTFGKIKTGESILINGASGGVGTFTIQLAKHFGATVTAVCSRRNLELVCSLGADQVIDYTQTDFTRTGDSYDLIVDNVGNRSVKELNRILAPGGRCALVGFTTLGHMLQSMARGVWISSRSDKKIGPMAIDPTSEDRAFLGNLLAEGEIVPVIDRRYPFAQMPEALSYLESGRARGKVIVTQ